MEEDNLQVITVYNITYIQVFVNRTHLQSAGYKIIQSAGVNFKIEHFYSLQDNKIQSAGYQL